MTKNAGLDTIVMPGGHPDRTKTKGRDRTQENEPDAKRNPRSWQYCRRGAEGKHRAKNPNVKEVEQTEICFQMCDCGRGYYGGLPAIRAYKVGARRPRNRAAHSKRCTTY